MKCRVEKNWMRNTVQVWLYDETPSGLLFYDPVNHSQTLADESGPPTPSFELREDALEALVREAQGLVPVTEATADHLHDAIEVRDRLLTMVEKSQREQPW